MISTWHAHSWADMKLGVKIRLYNHVMHCRKQCPKATVLQWDCKYRRLMMNLLKGCHVIEYHVDSQLWAPCIIIQVACFVNHHDVTTLVCRDGDRVAFICFQVWDAILVLVKLRFCTYAAGIAMSMKQPVLAAYFQANDTLAWLVVDVSNNHYEAYQNC